MTTTSKLGADTAENQIATLTRLAMILEAGQAENGIDLARQATYAEALRALLARQPAAIDKEAVAWRLRLEDGSFDYSDCEVKPSEADLLDASERGRLFEPLYAAPLDTGASKTAAPSVEQDERGAFIEAYMEARAASVAQAGAVFDNDWPAKQMWSAGIAYARAASTSTNVAQGAEAELEFMPVDSMQHAIVYGSKAAIGALKARMERDYRIASLVPAPPAQTALTDDARDAARYRWLVKNCFDWAAPGDGDSFDHIELHFEHDMLNRDEESVGAAIDSEIDAALTAAQSASGDTK
jgi:hypothetical protein